MQWEEIQSVWPHLQFQINRITLCCMVRSHKLMVDILLQKHTNHTLSLTNFMQKYETNLPAAIVAWWTTSSISSVVIPGRMIQAAASKTSLAIWLLWSWNKEQNLLEQVYILAHIDQIQVFRIARLISGINEIWTSYFTA